MKIIKRFILQRNLRKRFTGMKQFGGKVELKTECGGILSLVVQLPQMPIAEFNQRWPSMRMEDTGGEVVPKFRDELFNPRHIAPENVAQSMDYIRDVFNHWSKAQ